MNNKGLKGLIFCSRFAYPPNVLSLCGPDKKNDLLFYSVNQLADKGTIEILSEFTTLFPYLKLIAKENNIKDSFDKNVVEAYWLGNNLLNNISLSSFADHLLNILSLRKKIAKPHLHQIMKKAVIKSIPHHAFHVLNIYKRTGFDDSPQTIETMDACIINWGKVIKILPQAIIIDTKPLKLINNQLKFGPTIKRKILPHGKKDVLFSTIKKDDFISYHWGFFCQKLSAKQLNNLRYYTNLALKLANIK